MCCTRLCTDACVLLVGETGEITTNTFAAVCPSRLSLIRSFSCLLLVYPKPLETACSVAPAASRSLRAPQLVALLLLSVVFPLLQGVSGINV